MISDHVKAIVEKMGYRLTRRGHSNRFQAMDETLSALERSGFKPSSIIDGGANRGEWAKAARSVFPMVHLHLIEPLPNCVSHLRELIAADGNMTIYPYAATVPDVTEIKMNLVGDDGMATSAQVSLPDERLPNEMALPASSIDAMLGGSIGPGTLMKLDLQGHEIEAMRGAIRVLTNVEVLICEVSFYPVNNNGRPVFRDVLSFAADLGFVLYDFASLVGRHTDNRLQWGDVVLAKRGSKLLANNDWKNEI